MHHLIYTEVPLHGDCLEHRLGACYTSSTVKVMLPVRRLTGDELQFAQTALASQPAESPEDLFAGWRLDEAVACLRPRGRSVDIARSRERGVGQRHRRGDWG